MCYRMSLTTKKKGATIMLGENKKKDVKEIVTVLTQLDNAGRTIMLSNAMVLLARQEVAQVDPMKTA